MSSFLDARCQGKGEGGGDGFWSRASRHRASTPAMPCPVADLNLQIFPVKSANEHAHILTRGTLMNKSLIN